LKSLRENKIPINPRFSYVTGKAYDFLLEYGYNRFPISPFQVLEDLSDFVACLPWSEAKRIFKSSDPFHLQKTNAEARTIRPRGEGRYYIVYDDVQVNSNARIAWTIMHEIGHIILGHLTDFDETALDRGGLTEKKYGVLEVEAHYFAAEFLMPTALLKFFSDITVDEMVLLFGVSEEAAKRKHKRVFQATYMPSSSYEDKLVRNFFDFLESDIEDTIYKSIYGQWGIAVKSQYIPVCRKCPSCYTYITDPKARFCPYCGSKIEQKMMYKKMFERLRDRQQFAKIPSFSHPELPYDEMDKLDGTVIQRVRYCPTCLNHDFDDDADYCSICGQSLYSRCKNCVAILRITDCFCPQCGEESEFHKHYLAAERRLRNIKDCSVHSQYSEDWLQYPYWGYVRMRLSSKNRSTPIDLKTALLYSNAYIDDEDNIFVFTDTVQASAMINKYKDIVLDFVRNTDAVDYKGLEVYVFNEI
jgi:Zn-dependent peptidase ImmA (M78 family)/predicted amidophosphoribosyltransferase